MDHLPPGPSWADGAAGTAETHISVVIFIGDRAYKLKKPVAFPFVDLRAREARETICHREVELNRRLAPDVYLGVYDVVDEDGDPQDHLVVMQRMPDDRRLARLVVAGDHRALDAIDALAGTLAAFHRDADRSPVIDRAATPAAIAGLWEENFDELRAFVGPVLDPDAFERAEQLAARFLGTRATLLLERIAEEQICDGHGDLQADDVFCLDDGPRALDCIEFCDELRFGDTANDVAFLAMDLERLGSPALADRFVSGYESAAGAPFPDELLHFYVAYRAQVRAKVVCLRSAQHHAGSPERQAAVDTARVLFALCSRHLEAARPRLIVVGGLPGTGKTTVAAALGTARHTTVLRSDVVRKELSGLPPAESAASTFEGGIYGSDRTEATYDALLARAAALLDEGRSVVLDASFADAAHRDAARRLAGDRDAALTELCCVLDPDEAAARIRRRLAAATDASDATPAVATAMADRFAPWPEATTVSTASPPDEVVDHVTKAVRGAIGRSPDEAHADPFAAAVAAGAKAP